MSGMILLLFFLLGAKKLQESQDMSHDKNIALSQERLLSCLHMASLAAKEAGDAIVGIYESAFTVALKDDKSPLTAADKRSHEIISSCLQGTFPVLSEEGRAVPFEERSLWKYFWLIDPLDGTKEFIKRNGEFTVNIALINGGAPVIGIIYVPVTQVLYFALAGLGAFKMENVPALAGWSGDRESASAMDAFIRSSARLPLQKTGGRFSGSQQSRLVVAGSRSHSTREFEVFLEEMKKRYREVDFISAGSSLKFCLVAEGRADIYPRFGPTMEWDTAAGQCIVEQSEGRVLSMEDGMPLSYNKADLRNVFFVCGGTDAANFILKRR
jgi:3'(2'), 5'-bisphosphate nucleotidase